MKIPNWLGSLNKKDEHARAAAGLWPGKDGWYKTINYKKRYIARPMPLADVLKLLPARIEEINGRGEARPARMATNSTSIEGLAEMYIAHLWQRHTTDKPRKLRRRTYDDYVDTLGRFVEIVGPGLPAAAVHPSWFSKFMRSISHLAATSRRRDLIYLSAFFTWAGPGQRAMNFYKSPVQFGPDFIKPDETQLREGRKTYSTLYTPERLRAALDAVAPSPLLYAAALLALNCAFLPEDIATVPMSALNLDTGVCEFPRDKTGIERKSVLMPETIAAVRRYLLDRPLEAGADLPLFLNDAGRPFSVRRATGPEAREGRGHALAKYWGQITGCPFKGLRTTFSTHADDAIDQAAVDLVMGHAGKSVRGKFYVKHFSPDRLRVVVEQVWKRVLPPERPPSVAWCSACRLARRASGRDGRPSMLQSRRARSGSEAKSKPKTSRRAPQARRS